MIEEWQGCGDQKTIDSDITNCIIATNETERNTLVLSGRKITFKQDCAKLDTVGAGMWPAAGTLVLAMIKSKGYAYWTGTV